MSLLRTLPDGRCVVPVRTLAVEVVRGSDRGTKLSPGSDRIGVGTADDNDLVLHDSTVSRYHLELQHLGDRISVVDLGSTNGTVLGTARIERATVEPGTVLALGRTELRVLGGEAVSQPVYEDDRLQNLRGRSAEMRKLMATIARVGQSDASILVVGETGTGKELVAEAIHAQSGRNQAPFEIVDCGVLAPTLVASELFGHERGAFTGAVKQHVGAFERASGGTLFLDEIGELPSTLQTALLGALERGAIRRVGGDRAIPVDVRVVCATHRDLRSAVNAGTFREDLYYRIGVVTLRVPPLRDRLEDLPLLIEHFLREVGHDGRVDEIVPPPVLSELQKHRWPGNVRELRNFVEAAVAIGEAPPLQPHEPAVGDPSDGSFPSPPLEVLLDLDFKQARNRLLNDFERRYLAHLLERCGDNVSEAARESKIHRSYLNEMLKRHQLR